MPLPKISTPTYELEIPSTGKKVRYRPFLVKEEKVLVMALESEDMKQITSAIIDILTECILSKGVKVSDLATFDIEYLFLNIRAKSVGETVEVVVTCPDDGETTVDTEISIDSIKVKKTKGHKNIVKLDDKYSMKLKYPSMQQFIDANFDAGEEGSQVAQSLNMLSTCIEMIYDEEESWDATNSTPDELNEFVEQLNTKQFKDVENFFNTMPKLEHKVKVKNPKTGVESEVVLEGLASFFS